MMVRSLLIIIAASGLLSKAPQAAATATIWPLHGTGNISLGRDPPPQPGTYDSIVPYPSDHKIHEFLVTTDADILSIDQVQFHNIPGFYQNSFGFDVEPPIPGLEAAFVTIAFDTWITTPGVTQVADNSAPQFQTQNNAWFDTTDNGPQTAFMFARLTVPDTPAVKSFSGRISLAGATAPESFDFYFFLGVPEPSTAMIMFPALGLPMLMRRRRQSSSACHRSQTQLQS